MSAAEPNDKMVMWPVGLAMIAFWAVLPATWIYLRDGKISHSSDPDLPAYLIIQLGSLLIAWLIARQCKGEKTSYLTLKIFLGLLIVTSLIFAFGTIFALGTII